MFTGRNSSRHVSLTNANQSKERIVFSHRFGTGRKTTPRRCRHHYSQVFIVFAQQARVPTSMYFLRDPQQLWNAANIYGLNFLRALHLPFPFLPVVQA